MKVNKAKYGLSILILFIMLMILPVNIVKAASSTIKLNKISITVYTNGDKVKLKLTGTKKEVAWTSSDNKIAKVTQAGNVYGLKKGTATITATVDKKTYKCKVTVKNPYISPTTLELLEDDTAKLSLKGFKDQSSIKWTSSNKSVVIVDSDGEVTAKKQGTATITATINKANYTRKVTVTQNKPTNNVEIPSVYYMGNTSIQYISMDKCQRLFFAFQDKSYNYIASDAIVDIKIVNDAGEKVYEKRHDLNTSNFNNWTNILNVSKYMASIDIKDSDITPGSSKKGTIYFTVYKTNSFNFSESKLSISDLPYISIASKCALTTPSTPILLSEYDYRGNVSSTIRLDEITYSFEESYLENKVQLILILKGEKIFDTSSNSYNFINYKLYKDGYVVKTDFISTGKISIGDKFNNLKETIYDLEPGTYSLELYEE